MPVTDGGQRLCPSCGNPNPGDAQFCRECGAILIEAREAKRTAAAADPAAAPRRDSRSSASWIALAVGLLVIVVGLFAYRRSRVDSAIPIPGATPAAEYPTIALPEPTAARQAAPERATVKPPREPSPLESTERREPAPDVASREEPRSSRPAVSGREERGEGHLSPRQPGWYRMRFDAPLFESPSETAPVIARLRGGTRVRVTRVLPGFLAVESTTGKRPGFVSSDDALPESVAGPVR